MQIKPLGLAVIAAAVAIPLLWMPGLMAQHATGPIISQYLGMVAVILMSIGQVIATRIGAVERVFGGLDRCYFLHKWLGIAAVITMFLHEQIGAEIKSLGRGTALNNFGEDVGEVGYNGLLILVAITIAMFVPYHLWRWTHKVIGAMFVLVVLHYVLILKPFSNFDVLGLYMAVFCGVGVVAYVFTLLPDSLRAAYDYRVTSVDKVGAATAIGLAADDRLMRHRAGQFAFVSFAQNGLSETHPFTISNAPTDDGSLRFTIKPMGDFTRKLCRDLSVGTAVRVSGPHGRFFPSKNTRPQVWIAAGIGITPFVAWAETLPSDGPPVHMFYSVSARGEAAHLEVFHAVERTHPNFHFHLTETSSMPRLDADKIAKVMGTELSRAQVYYCGPKTLRNALRRGLMNRGVTSRRFHYEEFEIRSGLGIGRAFAALAKYPPVRDRLPSWVLKQVG